LLHSAEWIRKKLFCIGKEIMVSLELDIAKVFVHFWASMS